MRIASDVIRMLGVTPTEMNNWRKGGHLIADSNKVAGECQYSEAQILILSLALPRLRKGVFPRIAFRDAKDEYNRRTERIMEGVREYAVDHEDIFPSPKQLRQTLQMDRSEIEAFVAALTEERMLLRQGGRLEPLRLYEQPTLRSSTPLQRPAYTLLAPELRRHLRDVALRRYMSATSKLPERQRIPAPVPPLGADSPSISYRNLPRDNFGYNDPEEREIIITTGIRRSSVKWRFVVMHEYFHIELRHGKRSCREGNEDQKEAEATYAAAHYLVPIHTLDLIATSLSNGVERTTDFLRAIATRYGVSREVIEKHLEEFPDLAARIMETGPLATNRELVSGASSDRL